MRIFKIRLLLSFICFMMLIFGCAIKKKQANLITAKEPSHDKEQVETSAGPAGNQSFHMKLWSRGIDFYARGNEPFWSLEMDFDKKFSFKALDGLDLNMPPVKGEKAMDANVTRYFAEMESSSMIVTILEEKCDDTMADRSFSHKVSIGIKSKTDAGHADYEGCGQFVPDYGLHDIWMLVSVDSGSVVKSDAQSVLEFHVEAGKVIGNTGCNEFNGTFSIVDYGVVQFGDMAMTHNLCKESKVENSLVKSFFGRRVKYKRDGLQLTLEGYDGTKYLYKKVD